MLSGHPEELSGPLWGAGWCLREGLLEEGLKARHCLVSGRDGARLEGEARPALGPNCVKELGFCPEGHELFS